MIPNFLQVCHVCNVFRRNKRKIPKGNALARQVAEDEIEKFSRERKSNVGGSDKAIDLINYINTKLPFFSSDRLNPGRFDGDTNLIHSLVKGNKFQIDVEDIANIR